MHATARRRRRMAISMVSAFVSANAGSADTFIAGVRPHLHPPDAPVVTQVAKDAQWYRQALQGIDSPYPASLQFLEDQGAWYTPFTRPGMTGVYDLRGWHRPAPAETR